METKQKFSGHKRSLTSFFAREMIYDHVEGFLDQSRRKSMEQILENEPDLKREYEHIVLSINYCEQLSSSKVSEEVLKKVRQTESWLVKVKEYAKYDRLPIYIRWLVEGLAISLVTASIAILMPWSKIVDYLPEFKKRVQARKVVEVSEDPYARELKNIFRKDEGLHIYPEFYQYQNIANRLVKNNSVVVIFNSLGTKYTVQSMSGIYAAKHNDANKDSELKVEKNEPQKIVAKGEIYRATMELSNLEMLTPDLVSHIEKLGGKKAGRVELGWRKPSGSYFHFSIPQANYDQLLTGLRTYGPVRIYKDPHWRKMPEGVIRVILMVNDADLKIE